MESVPRRRPAPLRRAPGLPRALTLAVILLALVPALAAADGDPASDVLLGENVFYPYNPPTGAVLQKSLNAETTATAKQHFPLKVALIGSPIDLGVVPDLFGKPQQYADFLDQEISFQAKQPLLVVMAAGYGVQGLPPSARAAVAALRPPAGKSGDALAQAATVAVARLAKAEGHPVSVPGSSGGGGSSDTAIVAVLAVAAVLIAVALAAVTVRRRRGSSPARA